MQDLYRQELLDLYKNPLNKTKLKNPDVVKRQANPSCGDDVEIYIRLNKDGRIKDIGWQGSGCAISQAAVSLVTQHVRGRQAQEVLKMTSDQALALLDLQLSPARLKCALLGYETLRQTLIDYYAKTRN